MNELPNTVTDAQMKLREAMRYSTDPRWVEQQLAPPPPPNDAGVHWEIVLAGCIGTFIAVALVTVAVFYAFAAKASEPPRTWQVFNETTNQPWLSKKGEPATATGATACNLSLWEVAKATQDGTRLSCRRIDSTKGE